LRVARRPRVGVAIGATPTRRSTSRARARGREIPIHTDPKPPSRARTRDTDKADHAREITRLTCARRYKRGWTKHTKTGAARADRARGTKRGKRIGATAKRRARRRREAPTTRDDDATRRDAWVRGERARSGSGDGARRERDATKKRAIEREGDEGDG
jgi:hypothetical protein